MIKNYHEPKLVWQDNGRGPIEDQIYFELHQDNNRTVTKLKFKNVKACAMTEYSKAIHWLESLHINFKISAEVYSYARDLIKILKRIEKVRTNNNGAPLMDIFGLI